MSGESRGFSGAAVPVWGFSQGTTGSSGSLSCGVREVKSPYQCRGGARHCSRVMVVESGLNAMKKDARGLSRVAAGNPGFPRLVPVTSGSFSGCLWEVRDTMELGEVSRDSTGFAAMEEGLISRSGRNLRVPLHFCKNMRENECLVPVGLLRPSYTTVLRFH